MLFPRYDCEICQCTHIVIVYMALTVLYYLYTVDICLLSDVLISTLCVSSNVTYVELDFSSVVIRT